MYLLLDILSVLLQAFDVVIKDSLDLILGDGDVHAEDTLQGVCSILDASLQGFEEVLDIQRRLFDLWLVTAHLPNKYKSYYFIEKSKTIQTRGNYMMCRC